MNVTHPSNAVRLRTQSSENNRHPLNRLRRLHLRKEDPCHDLREGKCTIRGVKEGIALETVTELSHAN